MKNVIFRKIGGRIIPIINKYPTAAGVAMVTTASLAAPAIRRKIAEKTRGKGKVGFGNPIANFTTDLAIGGSLLYAAQKVGGTPVKNALHSFSGFVKRSVRGY